MAATHPGTLVASAATAGALAMFVRPWRFLSIAAVAAALLKSSVVADWATLLASSANTDNTNNTKDETTSSPRKDRR